MKTVIRINAFTLIELVIVISILALMITVPMIGYGQVTSKARDTRRMQDIDKLATALNQYRAENGHYPIETVFANLRTDLVPTYLTQLPLDPRNTGSLVYTYSSTDGMYYVLQATLENNNEKYYATNTGTAKTTGTPGGPSIYLTPTGSTPFSASATPIDTPTTAPTDTPVP